MPRRYGGELPNLDRLSRLLSKNTQEIGNFFPDVRWITDEHQVGVLVQFGPMIP